MRKFSIYVCIFALIISLGMVVRGTSKLKTAVEEEKAEVDRSEEALQEEGLNVQAENIKVLRGFVMTLNKKKTIKARNHEWFLSEIKTIRLDIDKCGGTYECAMANSRRTLTLVGKYVQLSKR